MKIFTNKKITKRIIIVLVLITTFNFTVPNYVQAKDGGDLFDPISEFLVFIADKFLGFMQGVFTGDSSISASDITVKSGAAYYIKYSPGIIFSGTIPALDINFINPDPNNSINATKIVSTQEQIGSTQTATKSYTLGTKTIDDAKSSAEFKSAKSKLTLSAYGYSEGTANKINTWKDAKWYKGDDYQTTVYTWDYGEKTYYYIESYAYNMTNNLEHYSFELSLWYKNLVPEIIKDDNGHTVVIESTASQLSDSIAKWYVGIRTFALVGLLSVVLYIGIRIVLSSTSAQNQSKYKQMLVDWLVAICILFVLHYIMAFILKMTSSITEVFNASVMGELQEDTLMSTIRTQITTTYDTDHSFGAIFGQTVVYIALVILTVIFTWQYLKRVVYVAFLTLIAPLIALTYPLDKIKDGKAQAFSMWLKEYIFNCLIQPVHLLLYCIFVQMVIDFAITNPLYAIVAIGFLVPAEKFFKEMFGMSSKTSVNTLGAAAGGAMMMNMLSKIKKPSSKGKEGSSGGGSSSGHGGNNVRTATNSNPLAGLQNMQNGNNTGTVRQGTNNQPQVASNQQVNNNAQQSNNTAQMASSTSQQGGNNTQQHSSNTATQSNDANNADAEQQTGDGAQIRTTASQTGEANDSANPSRLKRIMNATGKVGKKYVWGRDAIKKNGHSAMRGMAKLGGAVALGTAGFAAAVATDPSKMATWTSAGAVAGRYVGAKASNATERVIGGAKNIGGEFVQAYKGEEEYNNEEFDKQFFNSKEYAKLEKDEDVQAKYAENGRDVKEDAKQYLNAGITDTKKIKKAMQKGYTPEKAIGYMHLAEKCPPSILHNRARFSEYLTNHGIDANTAQDIYQGIDTFI